VTQKVPMIKGYSPNSPLKGRHEDEKSNSVNGFMAKMGLDFCTRPAAIKTTSSAEKMVADSMKRLATRSFSLLKRTLFSLQLLKPTASSQSVTFPVIQISVKVCLLIPLSSRSSRTGLFSLTVATTASLVTETQNAPCSISAG
jgi:hypothetical protein